MNDSTIKFTVSSRLLLPSWNVYKTLKSKLEEINICNIDDVSSVFGFVREYSPLYGGRPYRASHCLTYKHVKKFAKKGIAMSLNLTNHNFDEERYRVSIPILEKLENPKNSVVCTNDELAKRLRIDFPQYILKASVIKGISTLDEIHKTLELYDYLAINPRLNNDVDLLNSIDCKEKVILFANIKCLIHCDATDCFRVISDNMDEHTQQAYPCKHKGNEAIKKMTIFNLKEDRFQGFKLFKMVL
jgi:hypothetical protein